MRTRTGFTLVEMVAVTMVMAMLFAAVTTVLRSVLRDSGTAGLMSDLPTALFAAQLRRDLINARSFRIRRGQLDLRGPIASDDVTHQLLLVDAEVSYMVAHTTRGGLLLRSERQLEASRSPVTPKPRIEPVWLGVSAISLTTSYIGPGEDELLEMGERTIPADQWQILPPSFKLLLYGASGQVLFSENIFSGGGL